MSDGEIVVEEGTPPEEPKALTYEPTESLDVQRLMEMTLGREDAAESAELMSKLMDLRDREVATQAEKALHEALWEFKQKCPPIPRDTPGVERQGTRTMYSSLETIQRIVDPILKACGLWYSWSHGWDSEARLTVTTCRLSHVNGAFRETVSAMPISKIPKATGGQEMGGSQTYNKRRTLTDILGLSTRDDDDGATAGVSIDQDSVDELMGLYESAKLDEKQEARFWKFAGVSMFDDLPAADFVRVRTALKAAQPS